MGRPNRKQIDSNTITGTSGDDVIALLGTDLSGTSIKAGDGYDTLELETSGDVTLDHRAFRKVSGIEAVDLSQHMGGTLAVTLRSSMITQSDGGELTALSRAHGIDSLSAPTVEGGSLVPAGTGTINLSDSADNVVEIAYGSDVLVLGGAGNDVITAASKGSTLDGGGGNDVLNAGAGVDSITFEFGDGHDLINGFEVGADSINLNGFAIESWPELAANMSQSGADTVIDFGGGESLNLQGIDHSALSADDFILDGTAPTPTPDQPGTINFALGTTATEINAIIGATDAGAVIALEDGQHQFSEGLVIGCVGS